MTTPALSAELLPGQQNPLVQKYCAVCHTDAVKNGGLSLEHYDAEDANPALAAMLLIKLKGGATGGWTRNSRRGHARCMDRGHCRAGRTSEDFLLSPDLSKQLVGGGVDRWIRGEENASDHAPAWIVLDL